MGRINYGCRIYRVSAGRDISLVEGTGTSKISIAYRATPRCLIFGSVSLGRSNE